MVSEVIAFDQEQHPIKDDYLDDFGAGAVNGLVLKGRRGFKSQALSETAPAERYRPAWPQPPSPASPTSCTVFSCIVLQFSVVQRLVIQCQVIECSVVLFSVFSCAVFSYTVFWCSVDM